MRESTATHEAVKRVKTFLGEDDLYSPCRGTLELQHRSGERTEDVLKDERAEELAPERVVTLGKMRRRAAAPASAPVRKQNQILKH